MLSCRIGVARYDGQPPCEPQCIIIPPQMHFRPLGFTRRDIEGNILILT